MRLGMHLQLLQVRADHFLAAIGALFRARKQLLAVCHYIPPHTAL